MRVVVNQLPVLKQKTGIGHYTQQLVRCLQAQAGTDRIESFPGGWLRRAYKACARARAQADQSSAARSPRDGSGYRFVARLRSSAVQHLRDGGLALLGHHFRGVCARRQYDLYHEPNFIPLPSDCRTLTTLHDLSVLLHPEWHPADRVVHFEKQFPSVLDRCAHFLTVSEFIRQEVIHTLGVSPLRVTRVYNGIRPQFRPLPDAEVRPVLKGLGLPDRYFLYVGTIEPRKNLLVLLQAYCALPEALRREWPLLLVGTWGWNTASVAHYFHEVARHRGAMHVGYISERYLATIYNGAGALVYPSLYEGFGLPPLEMMACGGAVLASTAGALQETIGGQAHLIPADDVDGWRTGLERMLSDDDWRQSLRQGATAHARRYTWERCASETFQVYRALCNGSMAGPQEPVVIQLPPQRRAAG